MDDEKKEVKKTSAIKGKDLFNSIIGFFKGIINFFKRLFSFDKFINDFLEGTVNLVQDISDGKYHVSDNTREKINKFLSKVISLIYKLVKPFLFLIEKLFSISSMFSKGDDKKELLARNKENINDFFVDLGNNISLNINHIIDEFVLVISDFVNTFNTKGFTLAGLLRNELKEYKIFTDNNKGFMKLFKLFEYSIDRLNKIKGDLFKMKNFKEAIKKLWEGTKKLFKKIFDLVTNNEFGNKIKSVIGYAKKLIDIIKELFKGDGSFMTKGLKVVTEISNIMDGVTKEFNIVKDKVEDVKKEVDGTLKVVKDSTKKVLD